MGEEIFERVAQLQHENTKLLDELVHLKEQALGVEESLSLKCTELSEERKQLKSMEQQMHSMDLLIKEKDQLIDSLQDGHNNFKQIIAQLASENNSLKESTKTKNKQVETLKTKEENLKIACKKLSEENQSLRTELSLKSEECYSNSRTIKEMLLQVKELEKKKVELMTLLDNLLQEKEERQKVSEHTECFCRRDPEKFTTQILTPDKNTSVSPNREEGKLNLREELLEVELKEKKIIIQELESLMRKKEEDDLERNSIIEALRIALTGAGLINYDLKIETRIDSSVFRDIYINLLKLINWPEGQSTECKLLTDVPALSVVVKDGVQNTQPSSARVIETISIASQTDPIKNLSPVLPFRSFEKLQSDFGSSQCRDTLDEEGDEPLSFIKNGRSQNLFSEPKNCDLDMDMYRSCRKLSVLPEEDVDESLNRKSSLKKPCGSDLNYFSLKIHSADDIRKIQSFKPVLKETSSCFNVISKNSKPTPGVDSNWRRPGSCSVGFDITTDQNFDSEDKENKEIEFPIMSPREALRQPHSFDSYLDPLKERSPLLPRQASDPTQNTVFAPPATRRGSYIRRPKSTCRPLTLPCDKGDKKKEERVCKVRFDLAGIPPKKVVNVNEKESDTSPVLNNTKKIKTVSRFKVELVDEAEFRKSLEENERNTAVTRKRPPLIHSVVYKKSVLKDVENFNEKSEAPTSESNSLSTESPDNPLYDTATEDSPGGSIDADGSESNYPLKRRRHSDVSSYSFEDSQDSSEGNDILIKSIKLHSNSKCILMKDLKKENSDSSCSNPDTEIPYIDAEDLPVIKSSPDLIKISTTPEVLFSEKQLPSVAIVSPGSASDGSDAYLTPCDETPVSESNEAASFGPPKSSGLSKSPTVLKNLANFELLAAISESRKIVPSAILEEETAEQFGDKLSGDAEEKQSSDELTALKATSENLKRTSSDGSEASESDTLTYATVRSHVAGSSDCDSDTYVTVWSDKSFTFERKFSDLSENSSSPYNTPPDTSSASFCTPPDTYSPILNSARRYPCVNLERFHSSSENNQVERRLEEFPDNLSGPIAFRSPSPNFPHPSKFSSENKPGEENFQRMQHRTSENYSVLFDSPKLEFYETNDSAVNLEAFLQTEEGLTENEPRQEPKNEKADELEGLSDLAFFEPEDFAEASSKRNSLDSPKLLERRSKKHPPLSRQNSTEEYNFLDPHDSCLNLSEEISSPSTTPDTSNKTVIFKNVPLTVSNTIDLDDDFPISETEIQVNFNGSQTEIVDISLKGEPIFYYVKDGQCLSEPCTPSISSADFVEFSIPRKQRSSFTEESLMCGTSEANLPEIIVSRLSSDSDVSGSEAPACPDTDFASNVSDSMSKRSDSRVCEELDGSSLDLSDGSSASDMDSDNSRDVNLNSKKFTDCNLIGTEVEERNDEDDLHFTTAVQQDLSHCKNEKLEDREGSPPLSPENTSAIEKILPEAEPGKNPFSPANTSTPKQKESQAYCDLVPIGTDASGENKAQIQAVGKIALNQTSPPSNEEISKRFQDLSFAFKTDSMTIEKRLQLMRRKRDQAETNIENELKIIRDKLKTLQYLGLNSEFMNLITELKKQLDFVLNAAIQLSGSAEGYGYVQHEERLLDLVNVVLQHVENLETSRSDSLKASEKSKMENQRSPVSLFLDGGGDDDRILRRRSVTLESNSRRRASIATLPRIGFSISDTGINGRGFQWNLNRPGGGATKKVPFCQASPRTHYNGASVNEDSRRDSGGSRQRRERRTSEGSMKNIDESPEPQQTPNEPELMGETIDSNTIQVSDSSSHLKQLFDSIQEIRRSSGAQEHITAFYCLRRIVEWNKLLLSSTRFRWPQNVLHYVPFYITWYVVFVLAFVFIGGLFTGINGCYTYSCLRYSTVWLVALAFFSITRRFYRSLLPLFLTAALVLALLFLLLFLLIKNLLPQLTNEEVESLFTSLGLEIRYLNGPPPI